MSTVTVSAYSTDREMRGTLAGRGEVTLEFRAQAYERYDETVLAERLSELLERLAAGQREGHRRRALAKGLEVDTEPHWDASLRRFREERDRLPVSWTSPSGDVRMACQGLRNWRVSIRPGATRRLHEGGFTTQVRLAAVGVWMRHKLEVGLLRKQRRDAVVAAEQWQPVPR